MFRLSVLGICLFCVRVSSLMCCSDLGEPLANVLFGALQVLPTEMQGNALVIHEGYVSTLYVLDIR